ncbi:MAG: 27-O-demethylrifamycin SV methyltransferase [Thermoleophilaceae bacterium]
MIYGTPDQGSDVVAGHYDRLDPYYRSIWGEHVHHGLWLTGAEDAETATRTLVEVVAGEAGLEAGMSACDVGCGYGGTARMLAERGIAVVGLTVSPAQFEHATSRAGGPTFLLADWLSNELPPASFDAVIAIESLSHISDKRRAFEQCARVLRPGGRLVVCDWLTAERPRPLARRLLLEPICREGRLPSMGSPSEYRALIEGAGLEQSSFQDRSRQVGRTWWICVGRVARLLARDAASRRFLLSRENPERTFALSMLRIPVAYRTGSMIYGVITARKPS